MCFFLLIGAVSAAILLDDDFGSRGKWEGTTNGRFAGRGLVLDGDKSLCGDHERDGAPLLHGCGSPSKRAGDGSGPRAAHRGAEWYPATARKTAGGRGRRGP